MIKKFAIIIMILVVLALGGCGINQQNNKEVTGEVFEADTFTLTQPEPILMTLVNTFPGGALYSYGDANTEANYQLYISTR